MKSESLQIAATTTLYKPFPTKIIKDRYFWQWSKISDRYETNDHERFVS